MKLHFITGNKNKYEEVKAIIPAIEQLHLELPEIQSSDAHEIIRAKLTEASKHHAGAYIVEDTSLYLDCLNGLPGPLIKWFEKAIGNEGIANLAEKLGNTRAEAKTIIGFCHGSHVDYFEGNMQGNVVMPRVAAGFGWDNIFKPAGHERTYAEMTREEKNKISMRRQAVEKLKEFLDGQ